MPDFFEDNEDLKFNFKSLDLSRVVELREKGFGEADEYDYAPADLEDALDSYRRVLSLVGDISGNFIEPRAEAVDLEEAQYADGVVTYPKGTAEAVKRLADADLMGFTLPRKHGGLNLPTVLYSMAIEMVSRADAGLMTIFGLQDIAETINDFADEEIKAEYLPRFSRGEVTGAMVLTEPDAGSDLQAVMTSATPPPDGDDKGTWRINGVKRFITNGCGDVLLVMARSEPGTKDARGISLFIVEQGEGVRVRRIENKLGIHGSPTCEIQFTNAPGKLVGKRKRGLMTYVMALMNGARLAIAAQALGIAEAAYRAALDFAQDREQFGKAIIDFPAVYEMLTDMQTNIEAARALICDTGVIVDLEKLYERKLGDMDRGDPEFAGIRALQRDYAKCAKTLTPMSKFFACEMANKIASDAIQVHGGSGYMRDYPVERYFRDARITNIYEGTTQLQVVAAIGCVLAGDLDERLAEFRAEAYEKPLGTLARKLERMLEQLDKCVAYVKKKDNKDYTGLHARRIVEIATDAYIGYLLLRQAKVKVEKQYTAKNFILRAAARAEGNMRLVTNGDQTLLRKHRAMLGI
ncbi:MAG: acyl-CoA dehydrogenase family protein [Planctomycetota bacterium]